MEQWEYKNPEQVLIRKQAMQASFKKRNGFRRTSIQAGDFGCQGCVHKINAWGLPVCEKGMTSLIKCGSFKRDNQNV
jgi:hypothetical protein